MAEDRNHPAGRSIRIAVAVLKATGPNPKPDPVVYLSGGPGGRGIDAVESWRARPFARDRDIVLLDQRGTGSSDALCPGTVPAVLEIMARDLSPADDVAENVALARRCLNDLRRRGVEPTAYASAATAADLAVLIGALGYQSWNLLGVSYGTRVALTAARDHPLGIRSVILDSPFPPDADFYQNLPLGYASALARLGSDCAAATSCREPVGDVPSEVERLEAELEERPLTVRIDAAWAPGGSFVVNAQDLRFLVGEQLAFAASRAVLPALLREWRRGRTESLASLFEASARVLGDHDLGKYYAVQCHEEMPFSSVRSGMGGRVARRPTAFHDATPAVCADWQLPSADAREQEPIRSHVPALVLAGELDQRAPPGDARRTAGHLPRGALFELPGAGHGALGDACAGELVAAFLDDPDRRPTAACLTRRRVAIPLGSVHSTRGPLRLLRAARHRQLVAPVWLGGSLLVLVLAVVVWPLRQLWRWHRHVPWQGLEALAHGSLALSALLSAAFIGALAEASIGLLGGDYALAVLAGLPGDTRALFMLPKLALLAMAGSVVAAVLARRNAAWSQLATLHYFVTLTAALALVGFLNSYDLL
ncbi:MAG: alpha/beta fold hydrolase [Polyangiaceae bacterium]|nr:alpha/beta fold hydrolase [Polyangiaceae bacterium]